MFGKGVERNEKKAFALFQKSESLGSKEGLFKLF